MNKKHAVVSATSPGEMDVLRHLAFAWNRFIDLEAQHPDERAEFRKAIHDLQGLIATRVARRADPENWPTHKVQENGCPSAKWPCPNCGASMDFAKSSSDCDADGNRYRTVPGGWSCPECEYQPEN